MVQDVAGGLGLRWFGAGRNGRVDERAYNGGVGDESADCA